MQNLNLQLKKNKKKNYLHKLKLGTLDERKLERRGVAASNIFSQVMVPSPHTPNSSTHI